MSAPQGQEESGKAPLLTPSESWPTCSQSGTYGPELRQILLQATRLMAVGHSGYSRVPRGAITTPRSHCCCHRTAQEPQCWLLSSGGLLPTPLRTFTWLIAGSPTGEPQNLSALVAMQSTSGPTVATPTSLSLRFPWFSLHTPTRLVTHTPPRPLHQGNSSSVGLADHRGAQVVTW